MTAKWAGGHAGSDQGCPGLRVLAGRLEAAGFETYLVDLDCCGEPVVLGVTNPITRAYAEVCAGDGGLELRCWGGPGDDEVPGIAALLARVLTPGPGDDPSAGGTATADGDTGGRRER